MKTMILLSLAAVALTGCGKGFESTGYQSLESTNIEKLQDQDVAVSKAMSHQQYVNNLDAVANLSRCQQRMANTMLSIHHGYYLYRRGRRTQAGYWITNCTRELNAHKRNCPDVARNIFNPAALCRSVITHTSCGAAVNRLITSGQVTYHGKVISRPAYQVLINSRSKMYNLYKQLHQLNCPARFL